VNRNLITPGDALKYMHPSMKQLRSPCGLKDMGTAVERIARAISFQEKILIFGDYDVDGITSAAILHEFLEQAGTDVSYYLPHRIKEGYSLKPEHVDRVAAPGGVSLIVTADCGSGSQEAIRHAKASGIDVVVTDHHRVADPLPAAAAMVNPQRPDCVAGFEHLAGVGVAMALLICLRKYLRDSGHWHRGNQPNLKVLCDLVALGTIADAVPLVNENRIFVKAGIDVIQNGRTRPGIAEILGACQTPYRTVTAEDVAFKIAPRLNAAGRMDHARLAAELLLTKDRQTAKQIVQTLDGLNVQRKETERAILGEIKQYLLDNPQELSRGALVLASEHWHEGVLGIVAARLATRYYKPVVLISTRSGIGKGSGRSIPEFNLHKGLTNSCADQLESFGGHSMAVGLRIKPENIDGFKSAFDLNVIHITDDLKLAAEVRIDRELSFEEITGQLIDEIEALKPFGSGNEEPLFMTRTVRVKKSQIVGDRHRRMLLEQADDRTGRSFSAIQFNIEHERNLPDSFDRIAFRLQWNRWNGRKNAQLLVEDTDGLEA
jgi:single-stranded-DNA-specific exonuclease